MRKITKLRHSVKAISPIISVLLLIAIAVVASLVVYAWVMGYIGGSTTKAGYAINIQSFAVNQTTGYLTIYVQNVGMGAVQLNPASAVYINNTLYSIVTWNGHPAPTNGGLITIAQGQTVALAVDYLYTGGQLMIKIVTTSGAFMTTTGTASSGGTLYQVTFGTSGGGGDSTTSPSTTQFYTAGQQVGISATAGAGYTFSGWSTTGPITVADASSASTTATVNGAGTITATFTQTNYQVTFSTSGGGSASSTSPSSTQTYTAGKQVSISANAATGYKFSDWSATGSITFADASSASTTATVNGAGTITATFVATVASITISPTTTSSIPVGGSQSYTATAYDQNGNSLGVVTSSTTWSITSGADGSWAQSTGTYTSANTGIWVVTASYSGFSDTAQLTVFGALASFSFSPISTQAAGTSFSVTITAQDASGNTITNYAGPATLTDLSTSISPVTTGAFTNGVWTGMVTITKTLPTGLDVITATDSGSSIAGQSSPFTVNPGALASFAFGAIGPQAAGTSFSVTITAQDTYGNTITTYTGVATFSDLSGSINLASTGSFSAGVWTGSVIITAAYTNDVITATDSSTGLTGQSNAFTVTSAPATQLVYIAGASQILPINTVSNVITVQLQDQYGNPVNAPTGGVTVTLTSNPLITTGTFYSNPTTKITTTPITITIPAGSSSASFYFSDTAYEYDSLIASSTGLTSATTQFTITQYQLIFVPSTATEPVGQGITEIQVERETTGGRGYGGTGITVQLSTNSATGYFATLADGVYTKIATIPISNGNYFNQNYFYYIDTAAGTPTLTATSPGYTQGTAQFTIYTPALNHFTFNTISSPQTTGTAISITITAIDQNGNTFTGYTGTSSLTASSGTVTPATTGAFVAGVWTGSVTLNTAGSISISTSAGGATGTSNTFTVYTPILDHFTITASGGYHGGGNIGTQTAGTAFGITITAIDQEGNTFTGYTGTNSLTTSSGPITPTPTTAFVAGVWTGQVTLTKAGTGISISTSAGGATGTSNTFTVDAGDVYQFSFSTITVTPTAGATFTVTITAQDQYGNTVTSFSGYESQTTLTETGGGAGGTVPQSPVNFNNGVYTGTVSVTKSGTLVTITATYDTASSASNTFTVNAGALNQFVFSHIGTQTSGTAFTVTITAEDQYGNTVTTYGGTQTLAASGIGSGTITPTSITFTNGVCTLTTVKITVSSTERNVYLYISGYNHNEDQSNTFTVNHS